MRDTVNCAVERLNDYLEQEAYPMDPKEFEALEHHLQQCPDCQTYLEDLRLLKGELAAMPLKALPDQFEEELHARLVEAAQDMSASKSSKVLKITKSTAFKVISGMAAVLVIGIVAIQIGGGSILDTFQSTKSEMSSAEPGMAAAPQAPSFTRDNSLVMGEQESLKDGSFGGAAPAESPGGGTVGAPSVFDPSLFGKMIIRNGAMDLEVEDFDVTYSRIEEIVQSLEGYIESADTYTTPVYDSSGRIGDLQGGNVSLRIPSARFDTGMQQLKTLGTVTRSNISSYDVTEQYIDTQSRIKNLEAREQRLRELLGRAENIKDIIEIDQQLVNVRTEIDSLTGILKNYDKSLQMSSIQVSIREKSLSESSISPLNGNLFDRLRANLIRSINALVQMSQALLIGLVAMLPFLAVLGLATYVVIRLIRRWLRQRRQSRL